uniref:Ig-like domain-containing protein n=1 Tax=Canis lupus familiaris TaxID=9615 RepID=A0A8C0PEF7_CANLF
MAALASVLSTGKHRRAPAEPSGDAGGTLDSAARQLVPAAAGGAPGRGSGRRAGAGAGAGAGGPPCGSCTALPGPAVHDSGLPSRAEGAWRGTGLRAPPPAGPASAPRARARALCIKPSSPAKVEEVGLPPGWEAGGSPAPVVFGERSGWRARRAGVRPPTPGRALREPRAARSSGPRAQPYVLVGSRGAGSSALLRAGEPRSVPRRPEPWGEMAAGARACPPRVLVCLGVLLARWVAAGGPYEVEVNISSTGALPNGTLYAAKGSQVDFSCNSSSRPPPMVEWQFQAPDSSTETFGNNLTASCFSLLLMSQNLQGNYTCLATNMRSRRQRKVTTELLVYFPPPSAPQCWAEMSQGSLMLQLTCRWDGGYPDPDFLWTEEPGGVVVGMSKLGVKMLNQSQLSDGKKFKCVGSHIVGPELGASCVVQIRSPSLLSEPMKTCFVGGNVTLTCQVSGAYPLAKILWLRNLTQPEVVIRPNGHYLITQDGQSSTLTIRNCSQVVDEGYYVCRAENPVGVREVDIWLSVKEPLNIGGIVGTIVSLLLLGLAIISGLLLYYSPVFCWKVGNTFRGQDMGDVMVLVDSEEEEEVEEENAAEEEEEEEEEANEGEESPEEIPKHGHIHRVTALVNGNVDWMANGLQALQDNSSEEQSDIIQEEDRPV